jgi:hypothetical protein
VLLIDIEGLLQIVTEGENLDCILGEAIKRLEADDLTFRLFVGFPVLNSSKVFFEKGFFSNKNISI